MNIPAFVGDSSVLFSDSLLARRRNGYRPGLRLPAQLAKIRLQRGIYAREVVP